MNNEAVMRVADALKARYADALALQPYQVLVWAMPLPEKTASGLVVFRQHKELDEAHINVGVILRRHETCEKSPVWDKESAWVQFREHEGDRIYIQHDGKRPVTLRVMSDRAARPITPDMAAKLVDIDPNIEELA